LAVGGQRRGFTPGLCHLLVNVLVLVRRAGDLSRCRCKCYTNITGTTAL